MKAKIKAFGSKIRSNGWKVSAIIFEIVTVVLLAYIGYNVFKPAKAAADYAVGYINKYLVQSGVTVKLDSIENERIFVPVQKISLDVSGTKFTSYITIDGKYLFTDGYDISKAPAGSESTSSSASVESTGAELDGGFSEAKDTEVCTDENGTPIVYFFGSSTCPHCQWEKPILEGVVAEFGSAVTYKEQIDSEENIDVFSKYSPDGYVPLVVIGCKYYRVGSGETSGEDAEKAALKKLICSATGNQPASICQ